MTNKDQWKANKFVFKKGKLIASRDTSQIGVASRLIADQVAHFYDLNIPQYAKGHLLDLGCGQVPLYEAYKKYITENTCIDWENALEENQFIDKYCDLNQPLPLASSQYDTIILSDVLEHIQKPQLLWEEMYRVMKTDGTLLLNVPFYYWIHADPYDYFRYTKYALRAMAEEVGFDIISIETVGGCPEILADIIAKLIVTTPLIGKFSAKSIQYITTLFIRTKVGAKVSLRTANRFPLGYAMIAKKR